jgi:hypothetical protein
MTGIPGFANKWYYNTESGQLENTSQALAVTSNLGLGGWHELNIPGTDTGAQAAAAAKTEFPHGATPSYAPVTPSKVAKTAAGEAGVPATGINAIGDFFNALGQANLWNRAAKVVIGSALLIIGIAHITGSDHIIMQTARKVPLPI